MGDVTAWQAFATAVGVMGPVGLTVVATAAVLTYVRARYGAAPGLAPLVGQVPAVVALPPDRVTAWHEQNRDAIRDSQKMLEEMSRRQERTLEVLDSIATAQRQCAEEQKRTAEILDRLILAQVKVARR